MLRTHYRTGRHSSVSTGPVGSLIVLCAVLAVLYYALAALLIVTAVGIAIGIVALPVAVARERRADRKRIQMAAVNTLREREEAQFAQAFPTVYARYERKRRNHHSILIRER